MNRIVREHYPAAELPESLREGLPRDANVRVTIEIEEPPKEPPMTFEELFALRKPPYRSMEEIVDEIRKDRDAWDD